MKYARLVNNKVVEIFTPLEDISKELHPALAEQFIECPEHVEQHWHLIEGEWISPAPSSEHAYVNGQWQLSEEALQQRWEELRNSRNSRLAQCDWTQLPDADLTEEEKQAWAQYRQALRDLPENTEDPSNPQWPEQP